MNITGPFAFSSPAIIGDGGSGRGSGGDGAVVGGESGWVGQCLISSQDLFHFLFGMERMLLIISHCCTHFF